MRGAWGEAYTRGLARISREPFTVPFLLADLNFGVGRWFTNFSGDMSGRFMELAALTSSPEHPQPALLGVLAQAPQFQKADGHFGADVDWQQPIDFSVGSDQTTMMPILWGNGRLLLGLVAGYERFGQTNLIEAARKLGDFYVNVVADRFCDPKRADEYRQPASYACKYVTCVFEGMEGLVQLYRATHDRRYLQTARRMADFHEAYDTLPVDHAHGSLSEHEALLLLYEDTGDVRYLQRVTNRWNRIVREGFVNPTGGVLEKFWITGCNRDEGCAEADWLRLNLMLWRNTGDTRYLDMAERVLCNEYLANQWPDGGYGHRFIGCDDIGPFAYQKPSQESLWCCSFHGPLGLHQLKSYLAVALPDGNLCLNFPANFTTPVKVGKSEWTITSTTAPTQDNALVCYEVKLASEQQASIPVQVRFPEWAEKVVVQAGGKSVSASRKGGYFCLGPMASGAKLQIAYYASPFLENRRLERLALPTSLPATLTNVVVRLGPSVLMNANSGEIQSISMKVGATGLQISHEETASVLTSWYQLKNSGEPHAFIFNANLN
jgi:DUF1680 family protein